jgi:hypothetical protein
MMNHRFFLVCFSFVLSSLPIFVCSEMSQAQTVSSMASCGRHQEIFTFYMPTFATKHQNGAILNFKVTYRYTPEAIAKKDYLEFVAVTKEIEKYLTNYPNQTDFWEILNTNLVKQLLNKYPQMSALSIDFKIMPTSEAAFARTSTVSITRPQGCPILLGSES